MIRLVCPLTILLACSVSAGRENFPNILLIMTDDQGFGDIASHGNPVVRTPAMDRIAEEGVRFDRFFVSAVCAPTRASLLTGRYHLRCGVWGVTHGKETMATEETTVAEVLKEFGYRTALVGKWHLGEHYPFVPQTQGFDCFVGFRLGHWNNYFDTMLEHNGAPMYAAGYITEFLTDQAIQFIDSCENKPFFCYLPYNAPHSPWQVPDMYYQIYEREGVPETARTAYAMVTCLDDNIARLLKHLDDRGLGENTVVLFMTDNGPNGDRYNAGMKGRKASVHEGGVRVPLFIRWPKKIEAGTKVDRIAAHIDLFPTLLDMCGIAIPEGLQLDGKSLWPLIEGTASAWLDRSLFFNQGREQSGMKYPGAVRTQRYRWVRNREQGELYDMLADPGEQTNIASQQSELSERFQRAYDSWFAEVTSERGLKRPSIPVGYREENPVILSAPEGVLSGGARFAGKHGWANDWIVGWETARAEAQWNIRVITPGKYGLSLQYRCSESSVGRTIKIAVDSETVEAQIINPANAPAKPHPDRVPRTEPFELDWGTLNLGTITLSSGEKQLSLKITRDVENSDLAVKELRLVSRTD